MSSAAPASTGASDSESSPPSSCDSSSSSSPPASIVVHHLEDSRSQRVLWLLEELDLPYRVVRYNRVGGLAPPDLLAIHPLGKSPVITDGKRVVAESGAIVDYLINKHAIAAAAAAAAASNVDSKKAAASPFIPVDPEHQLDVSYWHHAAEGSFMPLLVMKKVFTRINEQAPWLMKPVASGISAGVHKSFIDPGMKKQFDLIEATLIKNKETTGGEFIVGTHLTAADFQLVFPIEAAVSRASEFVGPKTRQYLERIHARPAYKSALEKGGPYAYAKCQ